MGFVNSLPAKFKTATFEDLTRPFVDGVLGDEVWSSVGSASVIFYVGSSADSIVSEKYRVDLAGVILADPEDIDFAIPEDGRVLIEGVYYSVIHPDNVAEESKVIQIPVKRFG